jgi:hypothetical protein
MRNGDPAPPGKGGEAAVSGREQERERAGRAEPASGWIIETVVSPFHCLYQDALEFHKQSHLRLGRSEAESSRLARAALLLYLEAADALIHQAAAELARPEVAGLLTDPHRPVPSDLAWRLLPALVGPGPSTGLDLSAAPWPQLGELLELRASWAFPGSVSTRRAYYRSARKDASYEPLEPHQVPPQSGIPADRLTFPRTGLPRDPYALRPRHLDTARSVLDQAIEALDRRLGGALTREGRHRLEPVRMIYPG